MLFRSISIPSTTPSIFLYIIMAGRSSTNIVSMTMLFFIVFPLLVVTGRTNILNEQSTSSFGYDRASPGGPNPIHDSVMPEGPNLIHRSQQDSITPGGPNPIHNPLQDSITPGGPNPIHNPQQDSVTPRGPNSIHNPQQHNVTPEGDQILFTIANTTLAHLRD